MIFSFSREEEAQIRQFIEKTKETLEQRGTKQVKTTDQAIISEFVGDFVAMIDNFENARFSELDNQTKIIENAKKTAEEAIIFTYNSLKVGEFEAKSDSITISGFTYDTKNYFFIATNEGTDQLFNYHIEQEKTPARIFTKDGMRAFLLKYALKKHIEALKGTPGEQKLYKAINKSLEKSKYIHSEEFKGDFAIYEEKTPIYQGSYIDHFADVTKQEQIRDIGTNKIIVVSEETGKEYTFKVSSPKGRFGITTDKLLLASGAEFTKINNYPYKKGSKINYTVKIPLRIGF